MSEVGDEGGDAATMDGRLSADHELVALLLAEGQSDAAAGMAVGRSAKYVQRLRRSNPDFVARVGELKEYRTAQVAAGLGSLLERAVSAVARGLEADRTTDQLRAAALVFDRFRIFRSETEAQEQLAAMKVEIAKLRDALAALSAPARQEVQS